MRLGLWLGFLATSVATLDDFYLPTPEELNITNTDFDWGYNPWMPQYSYLGADPSTKTYVIQTGGCIPLEEGGSYNTDISTGWWLTCQMLRINCQCRPIVDPRKWNVENRPSDDQLHGDFEYCAWEIRRTLDEHRRGLIDLAGISAWCNMRNPEIYDEARELGVPVFIMGMNPPRPGQAEYGLPEPDVFIGHDEEHFGGTMAKMLKQLLPQGGTYGFVMQWDGDSNLRNREGFNKEMIPSLRDDDRDASVWKEVSRYPYEHPYNTSIPCNHLTCQMEGLATNTTADALIFLFLSPITNPKYMEWVESHRDRNLIFISTGGLPAIPFLNMGYLHGMITIVLFEYGMISAQLMYETANRMAQGETVFPMENNYIETKTLSHTVIPTDLDKTHPPQLQKNLLGNLVYVGYVGFGIVMATSLGCAVWTMLNSSAIVVRSAQPFFLLILTTGIVIFASTVIPLSFDDSGDPDSMSETFAVGICMSQPWLAFTGFSVIFSALFSKTWRVNRLFHTERTHTRIQVSQTDVLGPFAIIFTCNLIVLICWTVIDPLTYLRLTGDGTDFWNREVETYGACRSDKAGAFLVPLGLINFAVLVIACWQAFVARNIQSAFSESKYIALSVASLFQAFLTGFPILVIVKGEPRAFYLVLTLMIVVLSEGILLLIFLPKIYTAHKYSKMTPKEQKDRMSHAIAKSNPAISGLSHSSMGHGSSHYYQPKGTSKDGSGLEENSFSGGHDDASRSMQPPSYESQLSSTAEASPGLSKQSEDVLKSEAENSNESAEKALEKAPIKRTDLVGSVTNL